MLDPSCKRIAVATEPTSLLTRVFTVSMDFAINCAYMQQQKHSSPHLHPLGTDSDYLQNHRAGTGLFEDRLLDDLRRAIALVPQNPDASLDRGSTVLSKCVHSGRINTVMYAASTKFRGLFTRYKPSLEPGTKRDGRWILSQLAPGTPQARPFTSA